MLSIYKNLGLADRLPNITLTGLLASIKSARLIRAIGLLLFAFSFLTVQTVEAAANKKPKAAIAKVTAVLEGATVTLNGSASSDKDGSIASYKWEQTKGTAVALTGATTATASFKAPAIVKTAKPTKAISLAFKLTVTDNLGASSNSKVTVSVKPINALPVANAGPDFAVALNKAATLDASASSDDGKIVSYTWKQISGKKVALKTPGKAQATFTSPKTAGILVFQLTVKDNDGKKATDTVTVNATSTPPALSAAFNVDKTSLIQGEAVAASISTISGGTAPYVVKFEWGDTSTTDQSTLPSGTTSKSVSHTYANKGTFNLVVTVTDAANAVKTQTFEIIASSNIPDVAASLSLTQASVAFNTAVEANVNITGGKAPFTVKYEWGDGKSDQFNLDQGVTTKSAKHFYELVGTYTVTVTITDANGTVKSYPITATVTPAIVDPLTPCNG